MRQGAVDGHIRQVGVTRVGRGDTEGTVFTLTNQGGAVVVLHVHRSGDRTEAFEDNTGGCQLVDAHSRGHRADLIGHRTIGVDVVSIGGAGVEAGICVLVLAFCRRDERLVRVGSGLHLVSDEAS